MQDTFVIGVVTQTHGLKGDVKVFPVTDDVRRFDDLKEVLLEDSGKKLTVTRVQYAKGRVILHFSGIGSIEEAEKLKGAYLSVDRSHAVPLKENEYYIADVIGIGIFLEDGTHYGTLKDVLKTGANDVYEILTDGPEGKVTYIPCVREFVKLVDPDAGRIVIRLMKEI